MNSRERFEIEQEYWKEERNRMKQERRQFIVGNFLNGFVGGFIESILKKQNETQDDYYNMNR